MASALNCSDGDSRLADRGVLSPGQSFTGLALGAFLQRHRQAPRVHACCRPSGPGVFELFSGGARLSSALADVGLRVGLPIDKRHGESHDITNPLVYRTVASWDSTGRCVGPMGRDPLHAGLDRKDYASLSGRSTSS